jgi:TonB family protein
MEDAARHANDGLVRILNDPPVADFYPTDARRDRRSGAITLRLDVDAFGCMQHAAILRSSGDPELDDAAIELTEYATYAPAARGGVPMASSPSRTVLFSLVGTMSATASAASAPASADSFVQRGAGLADRGDYDLAIADFNKALEIDPRADMALADRGMAYFKKHDNDRARQDFDAAFAINRANATERCVTAKSSSACSPTPIGPICFEPSTECRPMCQSNAPTFIWR